MLNGQRFQFTERTDSLGKFSTMPYLPITLTYRDRSLEVLALLDTGASVNVLPYEVGLQLGAVWSAQTASIELSGNLASSEARGLVVSGKVAHFTCFCLDSIKRCPCHSWAYEFFRGVQRLFLSV